MESVTLEKIKAGKQQIINQMYAELENTPQEDRFYSSSNIESCSTDLDTYIKQLSQKNDNQSIEKAIRWIFESLSTFEQEEESPEYLWGFIYNGYTKELTEFILNTAFAFGLKKGKPEMIQPAVIHLKHNPHSIDRFRVYIGATSNYGIVLDYNQRSSQFEFLENIYGESYGLPVFDLTINEDSSELSFDVLASGVYKTVILKAAQPTDHILFNAIHALHKSEQMEKDAPPDHCSLELELTEGVLTRLTTMNYDANNRIINMFTKGAGIKVFVQELDANGCFQSSDNIADHPEIVAEKFVIVDAVPDWKYYEIEDLAMQNDIITVRTGSQRFEYENEERKKVIAYETEARTISYPIRSNDFIRKLLHELLRSRKKFKSRF